LNGGHVIVVDDVASGHVAGASQPSTRIGQLCASYGLPPSGQASVPTTENKVPDWQIKENADMDEWNSMGTHLSSMIESAFQRGLEDQSCTIGTEPCFVNLRHTFFENRKTGTVKGIRRVLV
jgi:hypothetical protein